MKNGIFAGKKIGVIGLARSGAAAANLAKKLGAEVLVSEAGSRRRAAAGLKLLGRGISTEFGGHSGRLLKSDVIIKSPGVPGGITILKKAVEKGISVASEIEFALAVIKHASLIAITGTNGKTTTTTLAGEIFKAAKTDVFVGGNIGRPPAAFPSRIKSSTHLILELSSYQLEDSPHIRPSIAAILNITPDHLEHHGSMHSYIKAKAAVFKNQSCEDHCVLNYDDPITRRLAPSCPAKVIFFSRRRRLKGGVYFTAGKIVSAISGRRFRIGVSLKIPGPHNIENALAAAAISAVYGIKPAVIRKVLNSFNGVEHRIEFCAEKNGVKYYNDSKGTNVDSTRVALGSFSGRIWLILGGRDKGAPYAPLRKLVKNRVKGLLLIGEAAGKIKRELGGAARVYQCGTLARAVEMSSQLSSPGDVVLLSPACASFDQFSNYEDRGRKFKGLVRSLKR